MYVVFYLCISRMWVTLEKRRTSARMIKTVLQLKRDDYLCRNIRSGSDLTTVMSLTVEPCQTSWHLFRFSYPPCFCVRMIRLVSCF